MYPRTLFVPLWVKGRFTASLLGEHQILSDAQHPAPQKVQNHRGALNRLFPHLSAHQNHLRCSKTVLIPTPSPAFPNPLEPSLRLWESIRVSLLPV